jgi:hypothetical protein
MSDVIKGYDRYSVSTPTAIRRGSSVVLRRQCQTLDHDTMRDADLNISGATAIRWEVTHDTQKTSGYILAKYLASGITLVSSGATGIYDITLTAADTKNLNPGRYKASVAVTLASGFYKFNSYHFTILATNALAE